MMRNMKSAENADENKANLFTNGIVDFNSVENKFFLERLQIAISLCTGKQLSTLQQAILNPPIYNNKLDKKK
ncbi:20309_t:CDS:2, partial [Racocetra persica]